MGRVEFQQKTAFGFQFILVDQIHLLAVAFLEWLYKEGDEGFEFIGLNL